MGFAKIFTGMDCRSKASSEEVNLKIEGSAEFVKIQEGTGSSDVEQKDAREGVA